MSGSIPPWLLHRLVDLGGCVPFRTYMEWVLHDPDHGYYGNGRARIGPGGDFATSPSLGGEFAELLLPQLIQWLEQIPGERLSLLEAGPGEGQLIQQVVQGLVQQRPDLAARTEIVLLDPNPGMAARQARRLEASPVPARWSSWEALYPDPLQGVVIAHEVLDALAVDRVVWDGQQWRSQLVSLEGHQLVLTAGDVLPPAEQDGMARLVPSSTSLQTGWCTELHTGLLPWFEACARGLREGVLLVIDYALEANRYYAPTRGDGTLMAYHRQQASTDPFLDPGQWDLTAHLCVEATQEAAAATGWNCLGERRQGEALLALGLAQRLSALGASPQSNLAEVLSQREQLLRLVDPRATGDFRWLVFGRSGGGRWAPVVQSRCLLDPPFLEEQPSAPPWNPQVYGQA
ncbi:MAG: SAM-dependent methyltransferase [Cyanobacteriota bacterium]|nr:SAM-dependent methyltransferase [Cyanobacteriota bacterium]